MKTKKFLPIFICLLYILNIISPGRIIKAAEVSKSNGVFTYYNADTTSGYNRYGIKGVVTEDNLIQFDDITIAISSSAIYKINNEMSKEYQFTDKSCSYKFAGRYKNNIYMLVKKPDSDYYANNILVFNMDNGFFSWEDYSPTIKDKQVVDLIIDNQGNRYFCILENYAYIFRKFDTNKNYTAAINTYISKLSDARILKLKCDKNNNIWFASYFEGRDTKYHNDSSSTLYCIENNSILTKLNSYGGIKDYLIQDNGHIWYIPEQFGEGLKVSNYINHYDRYGRLIKGYSVTGADSVDVDDKGDIWVLDSKGIKKLENDKFVDKYSVAEYMSKLSINKYGSILVYCENEFSIIKGGNLNKSKIDSFVRNNAYVTGDNLNNISIISRDDYKYDNLMITGINKDGSLKSKAVSILDNYSEANGQNNKIESGVSGTVIDSEDINNKFFNTYKSAKGYNNVVYVFAGDNELYQIKGTKANIYEKLSGKIYAIDIKENNNNAHQLYAVSKEILQNGNDIINIFLTSIEDANAGQSKKLVQIPDPSLGKDNKKHYKLEKFLQDKNGTFYIDVKEIGSERDCLFKKVDDSENPFEDPIAKSYSTAYAGAFLDEYGNIEYVIKNGPGNSSKVYRVQYSGSNWSIIRDTRFDNQSPEFASQYEFIQKVVQAYDGTLFSLVNNKIYTKKNEENEFKLLNEVKNANSIVTDKYGRVYFGTDGYGAVCYMHPNSMGVDVSYPGVTYMNISKFSRNVPTDINIEIEFNENIYNGINYNNIVLKDKFGKIVPNSYWINGNILTIKPEKLLSRSSEYTVTIPYNSITDWESRAFSSDYTFNFITAGETIPPDIVKASVDKGKNSVNIVFSEEIEKGSSFNKILFTDINGRSIDFNSSINGNTLTIKYIDALKVNTKYKLNIPADCVNDLEGNKLIKGYDLYFLYQ